MTDNDSIDLAHEATTTSAADIPTTMRAVRFDEYGDRSVLHVAEVATPPRPATGSWCRSGPRG